jgi:hypothetical protein
MDHPRSALGDVPPQLPASMGGIGGYRRESLTWQFASVTGCSPGALPGLVLSAGSLKGFDQAVEFVVVAVDPVKAAVQAVQAHDVVPELMEVVLARLGQGGLDRGRQPRGLHRQAC